MKLFNRKDGTFSALNVSHDSSAASKGGDGDEDVPTNNNHPYNDDADDDDVPTLDLAASKTFQEEEEEEDEEEEPVVEVVTSANGESVILSDPPIPYDAQELSSSRRWSAFLQRFKTWNKQPENDNDDRVQGAEEPPTSSGHGHSRWSDMLKRTKTLPLSEEDVDDVDQDHQSAEHANANQQRIQEKPPLTVNDGGDGDQEDQAAERTRTSCCWSAVQRQRSRNKILPPFLRGWTKRERILLLIAAVNAIVMFALLGNNVALRRSNNSNSSINGPQFAAASGAETQCGGDDGSGGGVGGGGTGSPTVAPAATVVVTPGTVDATPPDDTVVGANATVDGTPVTTSNVTTGTTTAANDTVLPNGSGASQPETGDLCGCASCTDAIWKQLAGQFTCGDRIGYLQKEMPLRYPTQVHACRQIAFEFPCLCGGCDPGRCNLPTSAFALPAGWKPSTTTKYGESTTPAPTPVAKVTDPSLRQEDQTLYCFPSPELRTTSSELWGGMVLQVKEDANACGPGNNRFSTETVLIDPATDTLTILYKDNTASEVRVLLPESQRPFTYGTYSFSIQSVAVKTASGVVLSNVLPKELVLGLFSWDDTEDYGSHENYNHEVDIEISRWNCEENSDLQFLVQPPGFPQMHRLFTGQSDATNAQDKYKQGGQVHTFAWTPGQIDWSSTAGNAAGNGNNAFVLKTEEAVYRDVPDYVQCMPDAGKNTEIRINLWNMLGAVQPAGLSVTDTVEVVIDNFSFVPSTLTHVPDGGVCSKHCQCNLGASKCVHNVCTAL